MDQIRSNLQIPSNSFVIEDEPKKMYSSKDIIFIEEDYLCVSDEKIPSYQLTEMQRRKKHFDEFKKLYNNRLEEKEARRRAEEEEQRDGFLQHPITKLLSKYGFKVPKGKQSANSLRSTRLSDIKRDQYNRSNWTRSRSSESGAMGRLGTSRDKEKMLEPAVSLSEMEIVDIYQRHGGRDVNFESTPDTRREDRTARKLREEIAELEDRFNCILKSFKTTFPDHHRQQFTVNNRNRNSGE